MREAAGGLPPMRVRDATEPSAATCVGWPGELNRKTNKADVL